MLAPKLRFREFEGEWYKATLEGLAEVERGKFSVRPRNDPRYFGGQMPFIQTGDVTGSDTYLKGFSQTLNDDGIKVSKVFPADTILITIAANIGDTTITQYPVACPDSVVAIQPRKELANTIFLKNVIDLQKDSLDSQATQNAQKNINLQVLKPLELTLPSVKEQTKIATFLSAVDEKISQLTKKHQLLSQYKQGMMQKLFSQQLRFKADDGEEFGEWVRLTTDYLFNHCLHRYVIVDAIRDRNVLQFQIDYRGKYTARGMEDSKQFDEDVEGNDTKELYDNPQRLQMITRYIVNSHDTKTRGREFTAMFCVSSVDTLTQYYELFEQVQADKQREDEAQGRLFKPLVIATIFSYSANEAVEEENGLIDEEAADVPAQINQSSRDKLDRYIAQYNQRFGTNYNSGDRFYAYYRDIADRVKKKQIDILLVVNMFLTGFDSKPLNTLYVDKNLKYHGLIQAFSRTNRVLNDKKPFGNVICFRNLKRATDEALALFSNKEARRVALVPSFEEICQDYDDAVQRLFAITPDYQAVDALLTEEQQLEFIKAFREVMRYHAQLQTFIEYDQDQTSLDKQHFANFASKYADLCRDIRKTTKKEKVSVLDDVDFQLDLLHSDRINVGYIINLLQLALDSEDAEKRKKYEAQVHDLLGSDVSLHDKQTLIQKFIEENMPKMINGQSVQQAFAQFWDAEKEQAYQHLCAAENLKPEVMKHILENYEFTRRLPRKEELKDLPNYKVKLFERDNVFNGLLVKTRQFIEKFYIGL